jgi:hypothetical protein
VQHAVVAARRLPVTALFVTLLAGAEVCCAVLAHQDALRLAEWASTNVARLRAEPIGPLVVSAFVVQDDPLPWLVVGGAAFAVVEWRLGWWRTLVAGLAAHVVGTLVSEGIVWWRASEGILPSTALYQIDVGVSYVVVGVLAGAVVVASRWARIASAVVLVGLLPALLAGITGLEVAAVGHLTSAVTGAVTGLVLRADARTSAARIVAEPL